MSETQDRADIDALIARFFSAFDNRGGRVPTLEEIESLFAPGAIVVCDSGTHAERWSVREFAAPRVRLLTSDDLVDFHEWETAASTRVLGAIATRESTYAKRGTRRGEPYSGGGCKFFHVGRFAAGWRISAVAWSDDVQAQAPAGG